MNRKQLTCICASLILLLASACKPKESEESKNKRSFNDDAVLVKTVAAQKGTFYRELYNNGMLSASEKATLTFKQQAEIIQLNIENGQRVQKGETLVILDNFKQKHDLNKSTMALEKSLYNLEDALISAGFSIKDSASVPERIMKSCIIKSGFSSAKADLEIAQRNFSETSLSAPFSGLIANCELKEHNNSNQYKEVCTLLNDQVMEVDFNVLESEYAILNVGQSVNVIPYALNTDTFPGKLMAINPTVSENGMITVKAQIKNKMGKLIDGMNVQVIIRMALPNKLIVPKEAIVLRQERKVVFTVKNDTAYWNYVSVGEENSRYATIENGIKPNQEVIVSGNLNIAHLSKISISN